MLVEEFCLFGLICDYGDFGAPFTDEIIIVLILGQPTLLTLCNRLALGGLVLTFVVLFFGLAVVVFLLLRFSLFQFTFLLLVLFVPRRFLIFTFIFVNFGNVAAILGSVVVFGVYSILAQLPMTKTAIARLAYIILLFLSLVFAEGHNAFVVAAEARSPTLLNTQFKHILS